MKKYFIFSPISITIHFIRAKSPAERNSDEQPTTPQTGPERAEEMA